MNAPVISRKPLPEAAQAHLKDSFIPTTTIGSKWETPLPSGQQTKDAIRVTAPREVPAPDDKSPHHGRRYGLTCGIITGIKTSTFASTLSRHFNNFLPAHKRYFNNHINRRTLLIMIGITFTLLALIIGLAAGLTIPSDNSAVSSADVSDFQGQLTFYNPAMGACGHVHGDNDLVMAISHGRFDEVNPSNPNNNPLCGRKIRAHRVDERTGKDASVIVTIVDKCMGCAYDDIDVSPSAFDKLADKAKGRVNVEWSWA